eukprot:TRINITY_DN26413_c0_g1_i1.p1 TRINITY_DN26413_c0_g1~~TRINITY_DN26413_c0_g1_i1.p1  ORF type:complete len:874 (-),score=159.48 TRINITY_DN26413_c0_g1_i1:61-2682(-)
MAPSAPGDAAADAEGAIGWQNERWSLPRPPPTWRLVRPSVIGAVPQWPPPATDELPLVRPAEVVCSRTGTPLTPRPLARRASSLSVGVAKSSRTSSAGKPPGVKLALNICAAPRGEWLTVEAPATARRRSSTGGQAPRAAEAREPSAMELDGAEAETLSAMVLRKAGAPSQLPGRFGCVSKSLAVQRPESRPRRPPTPRLRAAPPAEDANDESPRRAPSSLSGSGEGAAASAHGGRPRQRSASFCTTVAGRRRSAPAVGAGAAGAEEEEEESKRDKKDQVGFIRSGWDVTLASQYGSNKNQTGTRISLLLSVFEERPPTVFFDCDPRGGAPTKRGPRVVAEDEMLARYGFNGVPKMFFCHDTTKDVHEYNAVLNTFQKNGFLRATVDSNKWSLYWGPHPTPALLRAFHPFQRANHFPASWHLGRKDLLCKNTRKFKRQWPAHFDIAPVGFVLPEEHQAWITAREQNPNALWIWKPPNSACGKGIRLFHSEVSAATDRKLAQKPGVVQQYIDRPLLINGYKFDLRLYVVVTSYDPLKVYLYSEGLVRLATERYTREATDLARRTMHLTNYSVNKHAESYVKNLDGKSSECGRVVNEDGEEGDADEASAAHDAESAPSKWSLERLRQYFSATGLDYDLAMERIRDLVVKTLLTVEEVIVSNVHQGASFSSLGPTPTPQVGPNQSCFEIYGFDVMLDEDLKPWLLEVNTFPSLSSSSPLDKRIKTKLVADVLTLVGLRPFDHDLVDRAMQAENARRLQGLGPKYAGGRSHTVKSLNNVSSLTDLGEAEWRLILETHDEYLRRGDFERIYPTPAGVDTYSQFFPAPRYANHVLALWLRCGGGCGDDGSRCLPQSGGESGAPKNGYPRGLLQVCFESC